MTTPSPFQSPASPWTAPPTALVIFGASGDLTGRKLIPALFNLWREGYLAPPFRVIGVARTPKSDEEFRGEMETAVRRHSRRHPEADAPWEAFAGCLAYESGSVEDADFLRRLAGRLATEDKSNGRPARRLFYLAIAPGLFSDAVERLVASGAAWRDTGPDAPRVVIEKPFGRDLPGARDLNARLTAQLDERQLYRIDHYLGKETVQDILSFRFGNSIFEPVFNYRYVDHVRISVCETLGMEGRRGAYYDTSGALRDMAQNHMLQLLVLAAMEPPAAFESDAIHAEKLKILRAIRPFGPADARHAVRGQYGAGEIDGRAIPAYREAPGVAPDSMTETFVALRLMIDDWRWSGVPFFLRTGKCLPRRMTEIAVQFRQPPLRLFESVGMPCDRCDLTDMQPNQLVFRIQPDEGISLSFASKRPGMAFQLGTSQLQFLYGEVRPEGMPEAYERLLLDAMRGDQTLFMRSEEVEHAWRFIDSVRASWDAAPPPPFPNYTPGTWGPPEADALLEAPWRKW